MIKLRVHEKLLVEVGESLVWRFPLVFVQPVHVKAVPVCVVLRLDVVVMVMAEWGFLMDGGRGVYVGCYIRLLLYMAIVLCGNCCVW